MKRTLVIFTMLVVLLVSACTGGDAPSQPAEPNSVDTTVTEQAQSEEPTSPFYLQIAKVVGNVEIRSSSNEEFVPAVEGIRIREGAEIRTGEDGVVALYRDALSMVIVEMNSELQVKTLQGTKEVPVTILYLVKGGAAIEHHAEKLAEGAVFQIDTPDGNNGSIIGSTVRVGYNPETKVMTATCLTGTCEFVRGDQKLTLQQGQAVDVKGLEPIPGAPNEMTVDQANQFLAMGHQLCGGCPIDILGIRDGGLSQTAPAPEDIENTERPDNQVSENSSESSENSNDSGSVNENSNDSSGGEGSNDNGGDSGGGSDSGSGDGG